MNLKELEYFIHVAKSGNLSESAKALGISQPSLSRNIQQLESYLDVALFDRYHRPMVLTAAGEIFFQRINKNMQELYQTIDMIRHFERPKPHSLTIGFVSSVLYGLLPQIIAHLKKHHPYLEIKLVEISSEQQIHALKNREIDVGFSRFSHQDDWIKQIFLRRERLLVALPITHPLANKQKPIGIKLEELRDDNILLYHRTLLTTTANNTDIPIAKIDQILYLFAQYHLSPSTTTRVRDLQIALGMVAAGEGITLVPDSLKLVRADQIHYHQLSHEDMTSPIFLNLLAIDAHPAIALLLESLYAVYEEKGITYTRTRL